MGREECCWQIALTAGSKIWQQMGEEKNGGGGRKGKRNCHLHFFAVPLPSSLLSSQRANKCLAAATGEEVSLPFKFFLSTNPFFQLWAYFFRKKRGNWRDISPILFGPPPSAKRETSCEIGSTDRRRPSLSRADPFFFAFLHAYAGLLGPRFSSQTGCSVLVRLGPRLLLSLSLPPRLNAQGTLSINRRPERWGPK